MIYFDSSFLADYLQKEEYTRVFLQDNENESFHTTSIVRYELFDGALKHPSSDHSPTRVKQGLTWLSVEPFTDEVAEEASEIQHELRKAGTILSKADNLIAGQVREAGATLVTRDDDFERVEDLDVTVLNRNRDEDGI